MRNLFDYDGTMMRFMTKVMYLVATNILFLICSIPIVTIGASATAMHEILIRFAQKDEPDIVKTFFKSFISNLKKATAVWCGILVMLLTLGVNFYYLYNHILPFENLMRGALNIVVLICAILWLFVFPEMIYYKNSIFGYISFALKLAVVKLPYTFVLLIMNSVFLLFVLFMAQFSSLAVLGILLCGITVPAYFSDLLLLKLFIPFGEEND